jgi:hypothetical protein
MIIIYNEYICLFKYKFCKNINYYIWLYKNDYIKNINCVNIILKI